MLNCRLLTHFDKFSDSAGFFVCSTPHSASSVFSKEDVIFDCSLCIYFVVAQFHHFFVFMAGGRKIIIIIKSGGVMFIWAICHVPEYAFSIIINSTHSNVENNRHVHDFLLFHLTELEKKHISKLTEQGRRRKAENINKLKTTTDSFSNWKLQ